MRASEILRKLADIVDANDSTGGAGMQITNRPDTTDVAVSQPTDTQGIEGQSQVNTKSMVGPLQQKLELMKKMAGEESCEECGRTPCECGPDELDVIKQNAGIAPATVIAFADEDEPFEG